MWNLKNVSNITKKNQIQRCREQTSGCWLLGVGDIVVGKCETKNIGCSISDKHVLYNIENIANILYLWASLVAQRLKRLPAMWDTWVRSLGWEDPLEKEMATHSSILAWWIPWTEDPGGLQSTESQRVGKDWATSLHFVFIITVNGV